MFWGFSWQPRVVRLGILRRARSGLLGATLCPSPVCMEGTPLGRNSGNVSRLENITAKAPAPRLCGITVTSSPAKPPVPVSVTVHHRPLFILQLVRLRVTLFPRPSASCTRNGNGSHYVWLFHGPWLRMEQSTGSRQIVVTWMLSTRENKMKCRIYGRQVQNSWKVEKLDVLAEKM